MLPLQSEQFLWLCEDQLTWNFIIEGIINRGSCVLFLFTDNVCQFYCSDLSTSLLVPKEKPYIGQRAKWVYLCSSIMPCWYNTYHPTHVYLHQMTRTTMPTVTTRTSTTIDPATPATRPRSRGLGTVDGPGPVDDWGYRLVDDPGASVQCHELNKTQWGFTDGYSWYQWYYGQL